MEIEAAKMIGAAIAVLPLAGVGIGLGNLFSTWIASVARNPGVQSQLQGVGLLGFALTEAIALFALLIAFLILFL